MTTAAFTLEALDKALAARQQNSVEPRYLFLSPAGAARLDTDEEIYPLIKAGVDRRRIKREWRKAWKRNLAKRLADAGHYKGQPIINPPQIPRTGFPVTGRLGWPGA